MQRLHADDLAGHLLEQEDWTSLTLPARAIEEERWDLGYGRVHVRPKGEPIQPSRMGPVELDKARRRMGATAFSAQYQQQPVPDDGIVIRREWLRYYEAPAEAFDTVLVSWDTASTLSENADWSVGTVWGLAEGEIHLLDVVRDRWEAPDLRHKIEEVHRRTKADITLIEDADLGRGIAQDLFRTSRYYRPRLVRPFMEKLARMQTRAVMFETGKILLPRDAPWLATYLEELLGFPNRRHDDQVDSTSQALDWFQQRIAREMVADRPSITSPAGNHRPRGNALQRRVP